MREICLDTETTGIDPRDGHKIIEIACFELVNKVKTGNFFHSFVNPLRDVPVEAFRVHGISSEFLLDKPVFEIIADDFLRFIGDDPLVIHNAAFDLKFLNYELALIGKEPIENSRAIDTLLIARKKFPGAQNSLDALCKRFGIDLSARTKHGAVLDTQLLCDVYLELSGGAQFGLGFDGKKSGIETQIFVQKSAKEVVQEREIKRDGDFESMSNRKNSAKNLAKKPPLPPRNFGASPAELEVHREFILKNFKSNFWGYS